MKFLQTVLFSIFILLPLSAQQAQSIDQVEILIEQGEFSLASDILRRLYVENEEDPETNYWLAVIALRDTLYDEAIDYLDVAIENDEQNADYYFLLGVAYATKAQRAGAFSGAIASTKIKSNWEKAIELDPDHLNANWSLFQFLINAPGIIGGDSEEAKALAERFMQINEVQGHLMLAMYYWRGEDIRADRERHLELVVRQSLSEDASDTLRNVTTNMLNQMGYGFLNDPDPEISKQYFEWAIQISPDQPNPYDSMGDYYKNHADYQTALKYYEQALTVNPAFAASLFNKGEMLEKLGKKEQARAVYQQLIDQFPDSRYRKQAEEKFADDGS